MISLESRRYFDYLVSLNCVPTACDLMKSYLPYYPWFGCLPLSAISAFCPLVHPLVTLSGLI